MGQAATLTKAAGAGSSGLCNAGHVHGSVQDVAHGHRLGATDLEYLFRCGIGLE